MTTPRLPPQIRVFVRDWLSANNILLASRDGHVLVDTSYVRDVPETLAHLRSAQGIGREPLAAVINTHCHSDHIGGNAAIAGLYGCPILIPEGEAAAVEAWDTEALLLDYAGQRADRFSASGVLRAGERRVWGDLEWILIGAPGHDMGALVFYNEEHRILISGDALWQTGLGFVMPPDIDPAALPAARATLDRIAALDVRALIPGHGVVFTEIGPALDRCYSRLDACERAPERMPLSILKIMLAFMLLDRQRMALAELPATLDGLGMFRDFNRRFFAWTPQVLAQTLVQDLEAAGAVKREDGWLVPGAG